MDKTYTRVEKRAAQAMDSVTSCSRKRQRTGHGFVDLGAGDTAQKGKDIGPSAEDLYLDVRDGARTPVEDRKDFALEVSKIGCVRVKRDVFMPTPVGTLDTNRSLFKRQEIAGSLNKSRPPSNNLTARVFRKMAGRYTTPSTPLARIGRLEYQSTQSLPDNLPPKKANDTFTRAHRTLEEAPNLRRAISFTQHHQTATASKQQPVEDAWPIRRWSSGEFARRSQLSDSDVKTKDTAMDVERNALHLELDQLSQGLAPQSVHSSRLFWPDRKVCKNLPIRDSPVAPLQESPTLYTKPNNGEDSD